MQQVRRPQQMRHWMQKPSCIPLRTFSAEQVSVMNDDGKVSGTTVQDNIAMSGKAYSAGTYTGTVQYSSALVDA